MKRYLAASALCMIVAAAPALAQLALPSSVAPNPTGTAAKVSNPKKTPRAAAAFAPPGVETVVGRPLSLNGANGVLQLSGAADALKIDRLTLLGEVISDPTRQCRIDVGGDAPIEAKSVGRPDGLMRFSVVIPACPFEFDVLDGAALVPPQLQACIFQQADCQASPSGLWGAAGAALGAAEAKQIEQARARAETALAANYRALAARLNDPAKANDLARDQSRFTSDRQDICRDYARESTHGFCTSRLTEARAAFLKARFDELSPVAEKKPPSSRRKPKPPQ